MNPSGPAGLGSGPAAGPGAWPDGVLSVATWNIGYAGMGAESDFVMDLGRQTRPLSAGLVDKNLSGIREALARLDADVFLLQEMARPSLNTYGRDVLGSIRERLGGHAAAFAPGIRARLLPSRWNIRIGGAVLARRELLRDGETMELRPLAFEPTFVAHVFRKTYFMHILRLERPASGGPERWVLADVHLSAFDEPEHGVRERQLDQVMDFARREYAAGAHVVVGGDWNLRLCPTTFPHATERKYQFWIRDLPAGAAPEGWRWAVDPARPTVRTAHQPYVAGENMTLIVDGFLASPNVEVLEVRTTDLGFGCADHNPVSARFRAAGGTTPEGRQ